MKFTAEGCRVFENGMPMMIVGSTSEANAIVDRLNEARANETCACGMHHVSEYGDRCPSCTVTLENGWTVRPNAFGDAFEILNARGSYVASFVFQRDAIAIAESH